MAYNPFFDLAIGLFLILVPLVLVSLLLYLLFTQKEKTGAPASPSDEPMQWNDWLGRTLDQALRWKTRIRDRDAETSPGEDPAAEESSEQLDNLISHLEKMRNGSGPRTLGPAGQDDPSLKG